MYQASSPNHGHVLGYLLCFSEVSDIYIYTASVFRATELFQVNVDVPPKVFLL